MALRYRLLRLFKNPSLVIPFGILLIIAASSFGAPLISTVFLQTSPTEQDLSNTFAPLFSENHILGTDRVGRDVLTRLLYAGRVSLTIGIAVMLLQVFIGVSLGLLAGYYGSWLDDGVNFLLQVIRGIPMIFLLLLLSTLLQPTPLGLTLILAMVGWTNICRQIRALVFTGKNRDYIMAARAIGARDHRILLWHILPNLSSIILMAAGFGVAAAILNEATLSFLGFGIQPPVPTWGNMLNEGMDTVHRAPWLLIAPGTLITITVLCVFSIFDVLRDYLDPKTV